MGAHLFPCVERSGDVPVLGAWFVSAGKALVTPHFHQMEISKWTSMNTSIGDSGTEEQRGLEISPGECAAPGRITNSPTGARRSLTGGRQGLVPWCWDGSILWQMWCLGGGGPDGHLSPLPSAVLEEAPLRSLLRCLRAVAVQAPCRDPAGAALALSGAEASPRHYPNAGEHSTASHPSIWVGVFWVHPNNGSLMLSRDHGEPCREPCAGGQPP